MPSGGASLLMDAFIHATVRRVLFPSLQAAPAPLPRLTERSATASATSASTSPPPASDGWPQARPSSHDHSSIDLAMSYATWHEAALGDEKRRLKRRIRDLQRRPLRRNAREDDQKALKLGPEVDEEEEDEGTADGDPKSLVELLEVYALLKLFLVERQQQRASTSSSMTPPTSSRSLLHAQLHLYALYFEKLHDRKILDHEDMAPVAAMYERFLNMHTDESAQQQQQRQHQ